MTPATPPQSQGIVTKSVTIATHPQSQGIVTIVIVVNMYVTISQLSTPPQSQGIVTKCVTIVTIFTISRYCHNSHNRKVLSQLSSLSANLLQRHQHLLNCKVFFIF